MTRNNSGSSKKAQMFRFSADTAALLESASEQVGMSKTSYVMLALKHQFQADGLLPPDPAFPPVRDVLRRQRTRPVRRTKVAQNE